MVENIEQFSLFDVLQYGGRKKRGKYKKKEVKPIPIDPYLELSQILSQLANYFPIPICNNSAKEIYQYQHIRFWFSKHECEEYEYDKEVFNGESFNIVEAELIGTEDLNIDERLFLHKKLLEFVKNGMNIQIAAGKLQPLIIQFKNGTLILEK